MHKYKVGEELYFFKDDVRHKCVILEQFHLKYKNIYPTYKIKILDKSYITDKVVVPEIMLQNL